jgi:hypothetical protein
MTDEVWPDQVMAGFDGGRGGQHHLAWFVQGVVEAPLLKLRDQSDSQNGSRGKGLQVLSFA